MVTFSLTSGMKMAMNTAAMNTVMNKAAMLDLTRSATVTRPSTKILTMAVVDAFKERERLVRS